MDKQHYSESSLSILVFKLKADKNTIRDIFAQILRKNLLLFDFVLLRLEDNILITMPYCCCVPRCNGNYSALSKVTVFDFPKEPELKNKWLQAVKRKYFKPRPRSKVSVLEQKEHKGIFW